mmetsp:Transcript_62188/g.116363  ORF Transcript_62188/g.116363 Transcript_62188/m.116363 type:complete len:214 (-) Transcript_62188:172-813(-)
MTTPSGKRAQDLDGWESTESSGSSSSWFQRLRSTVSILSSDSENADEWSDRSHNGVPPEAVLPVGHEFGNCNPCVLFSTRRGCNRGDSCPYCHMPHADKQKAPHRPRKQTRDKYKQTIFKLLSENEDDVDRAQDQLQELSRRSPYMRNLLQGILDSPAGFAAEDFSTLPIVNATGAFLRIPGPQPTSLPSATQPTCAASAKGEDDNQTKVEDG